MIRLELSGSDLNFEYNTAPQLARPQPAHCVLENGRLYYEWTNASEFPLVEDPAAAPGGTVPEQTYRVFTAPRPRVPDWRLWEKFLQLADANPETICQFAADWGPLERVTQRFGSGRGTQPFEELAAWRDTATVLSAIASAAVQGVPLGRLEGEDYRRIEQWAMPGLSAPLGTDPASRRLLLARALDKWTEEHARISHRWSGDHLEARAVPTDLRGLLGLQLLHALENVGRLERCAGCGVTFTMERLASTGVRRYCAECRAKKVPQRDAMRDHRARKKGSGCQMPSACKPKFLTGSGDGKYGPTARGRRPPIYLFRRMRISRDSSS